MAFNVLRRASKRPRIGVTGSHRGGLWMWWFNWLSLRLMGARPVRITPHSPEERIQALDGLLIGGGDHISADLYDGMPVLDVRIDPKRDALEQDALKHAIPAGIPVLGVCRGAQMINVFFGGTLIQDIYDGREDMPRMWSPLPKKTVTLEPGSFTASIMECGSCRVNSLHSQAIDRLGEGLQIAGRDNYDIIQIIESTEHDFVVGVQWHPEFLPYKQPQRRLVRAFAARANAKAAERRKSKGA